MRDSDITTERVEVIEHQHGEVIETVELNASNFHAAGGEGRVHRMGGQGFKFFHLRLDQGKVILPASYADLEEAFDALKQTETFQGADSDKKQDLVSDLESSWELVKERRHKLPIIKHRTPGIPDNVATPTELLQDPKRDTIVGYIMPWFDGKPLSHLVNLRSDPNPSRVVKLFFRLWRAIYEGLHKKKILIGDLNPGNVLYEPSGKQDQEIKSRSEIFLIDVDSYELQDQHYPCRVGQHVYADPQALKQASQGAAQFYSEGTDYYAFATLFFEALMGFHPRQGQSKNRQLPQGVDARTKKAMTDFWALGPDAISPGDRDRDFLALELFQWFETIFTTDERPRLPSEAIEAQQAKLSETRYHTSSPDTPVSSASTSASDSGTQPQRRSLIQGVKQASQALGKQVASASSSAARATKQSVTSVAEAWEQIKSFKTRWTIAVLIVLWGSVGLMTLTSGYPAQVLQAPWWLWTLSGLLPLGVLAIELRSAFPRGIPGGASTALGVLACLGCWGFQGFYHSDEVSVSAAYLDSTTGQYRVAVNPEQAPFLLSNPSVVTVPASDTYSRTDLTVSREGVESETRLRRDGYNLRLVVVHHELVDENGLSSDPELVVEVENRNPWKREEQVTPSHLIGD